MDSWESVRHNTREFDAAVFELPIPTSEIGLVVVSTEYHDGNHGEFVGIDVRDSADSEWHILLPKRQLAGHSMHYFAVQSPLENVTHVRVRNYPDGGITRVGLFSKRHHHVYVTIVPNHLNCFVPPSHHCCTRCRQTRSGRRSAAVCKHDSACATVRPR